MGASFSKGLLYNHWCPLIFGRKLGPYFLGGNVALGSSHDDYQLLGFGSLCSNQKQMLLVTPLLFGFTNRYLAVD